LYCVHGVVAPGAQDNLETGLHSICRLLRR
jgi:hypothetical protein